MQGGSLWGFEIHFLLWDRKLKISMQYEKEKKSTSTKNSESLLYTVIDGMLNYNEFFSPNPFFNECGSSIGIRLPDL